MRVPATSSRWAPVSPAAMCCTWRLQAPMPNTTQCASRGSRTITASTSARRGVWVTNSWWQVKGRGHRESGLLGAPATWGSIDYMGVDTSTLRGAQDGRRARGDHHMATLRLVRYRARRSRHQQHATFTAVDRVRARDFSRWSRKSQWNPATRVQVKLAVRAMEEDHLCWDFDHHAADAGSAQGAFPAIDLQRRADRASRAPRLGQGAHTLSESG